MRTWFSEQLASAGTYPGRHSELSQRHFNTTLLCDFGTVKRTEMNFHPGTLPLNIGGAFLAVKVVEWWPCRRFGTVLDIRLKTFRKAVSAAQSAEIDFIIILRGREAACIDSRYSTPPVRARSPASLPTTTSFSSDCLTCMFGPGMYCPVRATLNSSLKQFNNKYKATPCLCLARDLQIYCYSLCPGHGQKWIIITGQISNIT